jgi:translation initiation factor 1A
MEEKFGDFQEVKNDQPQNQNQNQEQNAPTRLRMPRHPELLGVVVQRLGGNRMEIKTTDGKTRNCRVPGRFKRKFWLRPGDFVMITPWPTDDSKGDIIFQYRKGQAYQLRKRGLVNSLTTEF